MLLKGLTEARNAPSSLAAVEMVLVRLAYSADLPTPGEVIRDLSKADGDGEQSAAPAPKLPSDQPRATMVSSNPASTKPMLQPEAAIEAAPEAVSVVEPASDQQYTSLADIAAKAEAERDAMLFYNLRENVHEVSFEQGRIEIRPNEDAPRDLAQELGGKLKEWTGERWVVTINSEAEGAPTLAAQTRLQKTVEQSEAAGHPLVQAVMDAFPGAKITDVRNLGEGNKLNDQDGE
jgi:DNA polymerase-3 subunit gamma/tau